MTRKSLSLLLITAGISFFLVIIAGACKIAPETVRDEIASASIKSLNEYSREEFDALDETTVLKSDDSPTGYVVTFRYKDPEVERVRIYGEWKFSDKSHASLSTSLNAMPDEWQDGYFVWSSESWPTADMVLNKETGIWSYTIPLPCGTWNYRFYIGGAKEAELTDYTDTERTWDPASPPILYDYEANDMTNDEYLSCVYVPWDATKQALSGNFPEEAPRKGENGSAFFADVKTLDGTTASFGIYLPNGYNAKRETAYPLLVLLHGGGGTESSWFNQGAAINILDNMIAEGRLEPTIVVTPNGTDTQWNRPQLLSIIIDSILPYMEANYNVAKEPGRRAFMGLSMGGATTLFALFKHTREFGYYMPLSALITNDFEADYEAPGIQDVKICFGFGWYDFIISSYLEKKRGRELMRSSLYEVMIDMSDIGIPFTNHAVYSGHTWVTWRQNFVYMLENFLWQ